MSGPKRAAERAVATFLFACVAFSPPFLSIFGADAFVFGLPLLYFYLFAAWGLVIALVAWTADLGSGPPPQRISDRPAGISDRPGGRARAG